MIRDRHQPLAVISRRRFLLAAAGLGIAPHALFAVAPTARNEDVRPKLAVCLSSGGLHGYAQIGAVRAFNRIGLRPDIVCGSSVGAIVGLLWSAGVHPDEIEEIAADVDWFRWNWPPVPGLGVGNLDGLREAIYARIGRRRVEDLPVRFAAVATDLYTGFSVILDRGDAGRVVAASASVPLRYEPITIAGRKLVDGALSAPVPVDAARQLGADFCLTVDTAYRPYEGPVAGLVDVAYQTFHIMVNRLIDEQITRADFAIRLDAHQFMLGEGGLQNLARQAEQLVYRRRIDLLAALSQAGISQTAKQEEEPSSM